MNDNTVKADNGTDVYENDIYAFIDNYINNPANKIENIYKLEQGRWNSILTKCKDALYINNRLKTDNNIYNSCNSTNKTKSEVRFAEENRQ